MSFYSLLYITYSFISIVISLIISFLFWRRRNTTPVAKTMLIIMLCAAQWAFSDLVSALSSNMTLKFFWDNFGYIGAVMIPSTLFVVTLQFTNNEKYITKKNLALLYIMPIVATIMIWTNKYHNLFETKMGTAKVGELTITDPTFGSWYWIHTGFFYILIIASAILMIRKLLRQSKIYRNQSIIFILAMLNPFIGNVLFNTKLIPVTCHGDGVADTF